MHKKNLVLRGKDVAQAEKVLILLHGRGASAEDILSLSAYLNVQDFALVAPQATNHTWYPYSFLVPAEQNEPWLSSALSLIKSITDDLLHSGKKQENIYFAGFSQGACLTLEFLARNAGKWGGGAAFTGGLIGQEINTSNYSGDFNQTSVFIGTSDPDMHVPVERVLESARLFEKMNADVQYKIYKNIGHTIIPDEIETANKMVFK